MSKEARLFFKIFKPTPPRARKSVLFVDADGASLSVMAAALTRKFAPSTRAEAVGIHPAPLRAEVRRVLEEKGLSPEPGKRPVSDRAQERFDAVITLGPAAAECPDFGPGVDRLHWGVRDPVSGTDEDYRKCRDELESRVVKFFGPK